MVRLVAVSILLTTATARADDAASIAAAKAQVAVQAKALAAHADKDFAATLAIGARIACAGQHPGAYDPDLGFSIDGACGEETPTKVVLGESRVGWSGTWGWIAAEATITLRGPDAKAKPRTAPYHWTALFVADGSGVKTRALSIAEVVPDRQLDARAYVSSLQEIEKPGPLTALLADPKALAAHLAGDAATTVFGSSAADRGLGASAARRLLAGWGKLVLIAVTHEPASGAPIEETVGDVRYAFGTVKMVPQLVALTVFAIARAKGTGWEVVAVQYGAIDIKRSPTSR